MYLNHTCHRCIIGGLIRCDLDLKFNVREGQRILKNGWSAQYFCRILMDFDQTMEKLIDLLHHTLVVVVGGSVFI